MNKKNKSHNIEWKNVQVRISQLKKAKYNPRTISKYKQGLLDDSLKEFGLVEVPVVNKDLTIIAGHQRIDRMETIFGQDALVDVRMPNRQLTEKEEREYNIRSNKNKGEFDMVLMADFIDLETMEEMGLSPAGMQSAETPDMDVMVGGEGMEKQGENLQDHFLKNSIKQIIFNFTSEEFEQTMERLMKLQQKYDCTNMSDVLSKLIQNYEEANV